MTRTLLLTVHIAAVAAWLGADFVTYALGPRFERDGGEAATGWARHLLWLHERYYPVVAVVVLASGVLLVLDGDWSWSSGFIWVGLGAIVGGAVLGGGGLGSLSKKQLAGLEAGDGAAVASARQRMLPLSLVVTALPLIALVAMIERWQA